MTTLVKKPLCGTCIKKGKSNKDDKEIIYNIFNLRCWDFFPAGDCFRKQYESELGGGGG